MYKKKQEKEQKKKKQIKQTPKKQYTDQKDVLLSPEIGQYPCYVGARLIMDEKEFEQVVYGLKFFNN